MHRLEQQSTGISVREMIRALRTFSLVIWTAFCCGLALLLMILRARWANWVLNRIGRDLWSCPIMRLIGTSDFKLEGPGADSLPEHGIFIANHASFLDINALYAFLRRPIVFLAKASIRKVPLLGPLNARVGTVFVERGNREDSLRAVKALEASFEKGRSIVVFPEGTRSKSAEMLPFKKGAFHLAASAGVPVTPIYIEGMSSILPSGSFLTSRGKVRIYVGREIWPSGTSSEAIHSFMKVGEKAVHDLKALAQADILP